MGHKLNSRERPCGISAAAFTRSGGIIRCFSVRSDLYEYLEREKEELSGLKHISPSFKFGFIN